MVNPETTNNNGCKPELGSRESTQTTSISSMDVLDLNTWKRFFSLTGGSVFYCLSAVFIAYGIVNVMGPILSDSDTLKDALPCIFTLHIYEIALLGVLILIVSKKVVDDAISVVILMALFLVGTSIALGSVADRNTTTSIFVGLVGIALALGKFYSMKRFTHIPFRVLSRLGLGILITCNYLGPILLARSIAIDPSQESARRGIWLLLFLTMIIGAGFVIIEATRKQHSQTPQNNRAPFLQRPVMVYIFVLIVVVTSGIHQYSMAFTFALERALGDFVPVVTVSTLIMLEILRHYGKRFGLAEILLSCLPIATTLLAIQEKSVIASNQFGLGLMFYPPVTLALSGLTIAIIALYHRWYRLLYVVFFYGLGAILTAGFSPEYPHDLNTHFCLGISVIALLVYGTIKRNQYLCLAGIFILCLGLGKLSTFSTFAQSYQLTEIGCLSGVFGCGSMALYLLFGRRLHKAIQIIGTICLAGFVFDYLPEYIHWKYLFVLFGTVLLMGLLWYRRNIVAILILCVPFFIRLYMVAKQIAHWRLVILSFLLLGIGTVVSLLKHPKRTRQDRENESEVN